MEKTSKSTNTVVAARVESGPRAKGSLIRIHVIATPRRSLLQCVLYQHQEKVTWQTATEEDRNLRSGRRKHLMPLGLRENRQSRGEEECKE